MLQSEIKIVELQFHKLQRIIIIYFDCDNYTLTDQLHVTVRIYANVCTSCTFVVTVNTPFAVHLEKIRNHLH